MSNPVAEMMERAKALAQQALEEISEAKVAKDLDALKSRFLGKKSDLTQLSRSMKDVPNEAKRDVGQALNNARTAVEEALAGVKEKLDASLGKKKTVEGIDVTMPGIRPWRGRRHPLMSTLEEVKSILRGLGYRYDDYPEVEDEFHNFDALNTPSWHPARDMHDTFYTESGNVLRTHTTAFQNRCMKTVAKPPLRAMTAGRCYRNDEIDASHFPIFHQLDVIAIDRNISFADLKQTLYELARGLFGPETQLQFRPSFFPFTTPSAEVDVMFNGSWLEILGSGMMRPEVLRQGGLDPDEWQGFAFGLGIDRMAMIRHSIDDIRLLYGNEEPFLRQF